MHLLLIYDQLVFGQKVFPPSHFEDTQKYFRIELPKQSLQAAYKNMKATVFHQKATTNFWFLHSEIENTSLKSFLVWLPLASELPSIPCYLFVLDVISLFLNELICLHDHCAQDFQKTCQNSTPKCNRYPICLNSICKFESRYVLHQIGLIFLL